MARALVTRIRKLESRVAQVDKQSMGYTNKPAFDWEAYDRAFAEFWESHGENVRETNQEA